MHFCFVFIGSGYIRKLIHLLVDGSTSDRFSSEKLNPELTHRQQLLPPERSFFQQSLVLLFCSGGLLVSYLIWGILQERVMVYRYRESEDEPGELFTNSQFIVFMNRILALVIACIAMMFVKQKPHEAPLYKYSYSSLSNIMSSWCQYEALKFVSFPVQVIAVVTCPLWIGEMDTPVISYTQIFGASEGHCTLYNCRNVKHLDLDCSLDIWILIWNTIKISAL